MPFCNANLKSKPGEKCKCKTKKQGQRCKRHTPFVSNALTYRQLAPTEMEKNFNKYLVAQQKYKSKLTADQKQIMEEWTFMGFGNLFNNSLRQGGSITPEARILQKTILDSPDTPRLLVYRGINFQSDNPLYKKMKSGTQQSLEELSYGFQSVSMYPQVTINFARGSMVEREYKGQRGISIIFHIIVQPGSKMLYLNNDELLLPSGTVFRQISPLIKYEVPRNSDDMRWYEKLYSYLFSSPQDFLEFKNSEPVRYLEYKQKFEDDQLKLGETDKLHHVLVTIVKQKKGPLRPRIISTTRPQEFKRRQIPYLEKEETHTEHEKALMKRMYKDNRSERAKEIDRQKRLKRERGELFEKERNKGSKDYEWEDMSQKNKKRKTLPFFND